MNFYKYVLMTMAFVLGLHLYDTVAAEALIFYCITTADTNVLEEIRLILNYTHLFMFVICMILIVIAIGLYLAEFYVCKYIKGKRAV